MVFRAGKRTKYIPTVFRILLLGVPFAILVKWFFWYIFCPSYERTSSPEIDAPRGGPRKIPDVKDDFRKLKGIGPKTADIYTVREY